MNNEFNQQNGSNSMSNNINNGMNNQMNEIPNNINNGMNNQMNEIPNNMNNGMNNQMNEIPNNMNNGMNNQMNQMPNNMNNPMNQMPNNINNGMNNQMNEIPNNMNNGMNNPMNEIPNNINNGMNNQNNFGFQGQTAQYTNSENNNSATVKEEKNIKKNEIIEKILSVIKKPLAIKIIAGVLVLLICSGVGYWFFNRDYFAEKALISAYFDKDNYIPVVEDGVYGYIDTDGDMVISPQYYFASSFIEDYAIVTNGSIYDYEYIIINKKGEEVMTADYMYYSDKGVYIIDGVLYDLDLKPLSDSSVEVQSIEGEYALWTTDTTSGTMDLSGDIIYTYNDSSIDLIVGNDADILSKNYCVVSHSSKNAIINCDTGEVIYDYIAGEITSEEYNTFGINTSSGDFLEYVFINKDKVVYTSSKDYDGFELSSDGKYLVGREYVSWNEYDYTYIKISDGEETTDISSIDSEFYSYDYWEDLTGYTEYSNGDYEGFMKGDSVKVSASYDNIYYFNEYTAKYLHYKNKDYVIVKKDSVFSILDIKKDKIVYTFKNSYPTDSDSVFTYSYDSDGSYDVYNMINGKSENFTNVDSVKLGTNYFTITTDDKVQYYNYDFELIYTA